MDKLNYPKNKEKKQKLWASYYQKNKEKIRLNAKKYRKYFPEKKREYYLKNKEKINAYNRKYMREYMRSYMAKKKNDPTFVEKRKKYYLENAEKIKESAQKSRMKNLPKIRERMKVYFKERRKEDVNFRIASNLRTRLGKFIRRKQKLGSAVTDLGCSIKELKFYLEGKFKDGMSWDNYGKWHIDHIVPLSFFDLTNKEQFLTACHYTNLQPLWAKENILKSNKILV